MFLNFLFSLVSNNQLRGANDLDRAQILQWLSFADSEILPPACTWLFPLLGIIQYNKQVGNLLKEFKIILVYIKYIKFLFL